MSVTVKIVHISLLYAALWKNVETVTSILSLLMVNKKCLNMFLNSCRLKGSLRKINSEFCATYSGSHLGEKSQKPITLKNKGHINHC